jgi:hypothetical protein
MKTGRVPPHSNPGLAGVRSQSTGQTCPSPSIVPLTHSCKVLLSDETLLMVNSYSGNGLLQLSRDTGVKIALANPGDFFPGTFERCLWISGHKGPVVTFLWNMAVRAPVLMNTFSLLFTNTSVSAIIGRKGATVKAIQIATGCQIKVGQKIPGVSERTVRIAGPSGESVFKALGDILDKTFEDPSLSQMVSVSYAHVYKADPVEFQNYMAKCMQELVSPPAKKLRYS